MITEQLKTALNNVEKLSLKHQDLLAKQILESIEEMEWDEKWDETLATPESQAYCAKREAEIVAEHLAGRTIEYIPG